MLIKTETDVYTS